MKIAIIGTRGIPNFYGGFEQFAEYLAKGLVAKDHSVTVYNSHTHPFQESTWNGITIIHKRDPEDKLGTVGQFIYDLNCIRDLKKHNYDIILQLGYTSSSIWNKLLPSNPVLITNMDGLEWKRSKFNRITQYFLTFAEKLAVYSSDFLVSDSIGIQQHLTTTYGTDSTFIPYGANIFENPTQDILIEYELQPYEYNLVIARMEPENNIEIIIKGHLASELKRKLIIIGNLNNKFAKYLISKYQSDYIVFIGGVYDQNKLNNLRYYSNLYFHGHSVGGTNPSLLEAMASNSLICSHDNIFNRSILQDDAYYFNNEKGVVNILTMNHEPKASSEKIGNNKIKIKNIYTWETIIDQYEELFLKSIINA